VESISSVIGIPITDDLGKYLGVPTLSRRVNKATFQYVIDRWINALRDGERSVSLLGRVTLIKSTLTTIPAHTIQTCRLPRTVCGGLDRKVRRFLWAGSNAEWKPHLVAWATVTNPLTHGGLGLRPIRDLNSASTAKVGWRMLRDSEVIWARVLTLET